MSTAVRPPMRHALAELQQASEDFEWYPTTPEILAEIATSIRNKIDRYHRGAIKLLDIGAGDGRALTRLQEMLTDEENSWNTVSLSQFAIEKSLVHLHNMPKHIVVIGTEFREQTLADKEVDVVFCNPPYSEYEDWAYRILKECAATHVYLVIPRRWRKCPRLTSLVEDLGLEAESLGEFDFERAERQARAQVEIVCFDMSARGKHAAFDAAIEEMLPELERFENELDDAPAPVWDDQLAVGGSPIDSLVVAYDTELDELYATYRAVVKINPRILKELGVTKANILTGLRQKITGLKNKYWAILFEHLADVTKRLATKQRKAFLESLRSKTVIDFTHGNVRSMLIWIVKWANDYFDEQLIELFQTLAKKCNVHQYKSNHKVWVEDRWRYNNGPDPNSHYKVDYRLVVHMYNAIVDPDRRWDGQNGLATGCHEFLGDFVTVANNLGFACQDSSWHRHWASGVKHTLLLADGAPLMDVKAFQNGNLHIRVSKRVMLAINVQVGKLLGWIHSAEEAVRELEPDAEDVEFVGEVFRRPNRLGPAQLLQLGVAAGGLSHGSAK